MRRTLIAICCLALLAGRPAPRAAAQDHGHDHGAPDAAPTVAVTRWTDTVELFMEVPVLTAYASGRFAIHLTVLDGFRPVREGTVTLVFTAPGGVREVRTADTPARPGVFAPDVGLARAGTYDLALTYEGPDAAATFTIPGVRVRDRDAPPGGHGHAHDDAGAQGITFLKEQQWQVPFATALAAERDVRRTVRAVGRVLPAPAAYAEIAAPVDGVLHVAGPGDLALPGARVARGDVVARLAPPLQGESWTSSRLALAQAERDYARARRLRERDAISARAFEEAENAYLARKAGHELLAGAGDGGVLALTAPLDGRVVEWQVRPGQRLRAGDPLMAIADPRVVWLRVNVPAAAFRDLGTPVGARVGGDDGWDVPDGAMTVLSAGGALDPATRTVPVLLEIANDAGRLAIGDTAPVELHASDGVRATAVPRSAVFEDEGLDVVFVQTGGESFAKRVVRTGPRHAGWVSILAGVAPGERVVTRGGYHVKLAGTTAEIGHGHAH